MRLLALAALLLVPHVLAAQGFRTFSGRNHPEIDWRVAETEHFEIVYPARLAGIEAEAATVAEETYAALSANLGVTFDRPIRVYLSDEDEIANGFAVDVGRAGFTNVWVHVNETASIWTGDAKWLRTVVAHEIAHIFHYRAIRSPIGLLQNVFANPIPSFWAEGFAQYQTERWDAQRGDRWLRTAVFEDRLSFSDGTSAWNGRLRYAVGNSQVRYLAESRGDSTITNILNHRRTLLPGVKVHDFYGAFKAEVGTPYREFYDEWRKHVNVYYNTLAGEMERADSLGTALKIPSAYLYDVAYSPDTSLVAALVLSSVARPVRRLALVEGLSDTTVTRRVRVLAEGSIEAPVAWSRDGERIAFARTVRGRYGSLVNDLYVVDVASGETERLTHDRRASSPTFAPDGRLAFVGSSGRRRTCSCSTRRPVPRPRSPASPATSSSPRSASARTAAASPSPASMPGARATSPSSTSAPARSKRCRSAEPTTGCRCGARTARPSPSPRSATTCRTCSCWTSGPPPGSRSLARLAPSFAGLSPSSRGTVRTCIALLKHVRTGGPSAGSPTSSAGRRRTTGSRRTRSTRRAGSSSSRARASAASRPSPWTRAGP